MKAKLLIAAVFAFCLTACGNQVKNQTEPIVANVKADGPTVYTNFCISCHGNNLQGGKGPNLQKIGARLDREDMIKRIQKGGGGMPPFQVALKDDELQALTAWLAEMK